MSRKDPYRFVQEWFKAVGRCQWHATDFLQAIDGAHCGEFYCFQCASEARQTQRIRPALGGPR
jgi:hypothetical protein